MIYIVSVLMLIVSFGFLNAPGRSAWYIAAALSLGFGGIGGVGLHSWPAIGIGIAATIVCGIGFACASDKNANLKKLSYSTCTAKPDQRLLQFLPPEMQKGPWGDNGDSIIAHSFTDPALMIVWTAHGIQPEKVRRWIESLTMAGASQTINGWNVSGAMLLHPVGLDFLASQDEHPTYPDRQHQWLHIAHESCRFVGGEIRGFHDSRLFDQNGQPRITGTAVPPASTLPPR